jgi:HEPN domain-containing protein
MPHSDRHRELVRQWIVLAQEDLDSAHRLLQPEPIIRGSAYHCQQAMEKATKGYLTWHQQDFPWTHNIEQLVLQCQQIDPEFVEILPAAEYLSPLASAPRYPADDLLLTLDEARYALKLANDALEFIRARLPDDVQS